MSKVDEVRTVERFRCSACGRLVGKSRWGRLASHQVGAGGDICAGSGALLSDAHPGDDEGEEVSRDRRELWLLDNYLAVNGTNPGQHERRRLLHQYLCETCTHEWADVSGWGGSPEGTHQCSWCNEVLTPEEWRESHAARAAGETGEVERRG